MVNFNAQIECFGVKGEKTGWIYIFVPEELALQIKPATRKSYRVRGKIDAVEIGGMSLIPMREGDYILALNAKLRKALNKSVDDKVTVTLEEDTEFKIIMPDDLEACLMEDERFYDKFLSQPKSHQNYFIKWINDARTEVTREKRLLMTVNAMAEGLDYGGMIRAARKE